MSQVAGVRLAAAIVSIALAATSTDAQTELNALSFMSGTWCSEPDAGGTVLEEHYTTPTQNLMVGVTRFVRDGRTVSHELSRIELRGEAVVLTAMPSGQTPVPFTLTEAGPARAVFENPDHDFPVRILYTRTETGLVARIEGQDGAGREWHMAPCRGVGHRGL